MKVLVVLIGTGVFLVPILDRPDLTFEDEVLHALILL